MIYSMAVLSFLFGFFILNSARAYGEKDLGNEAFLQFTSTFSGLFAIFRFILSISIDFTSYKLVYAILLSVQIFLAFTLPILTTFYPKEDFTFGFFFLTVGTCQLTAGGHLTILPTVFAKLFGVDGGTRMYTVGLSFVGIASLINYQLTDRLLDGTWGDVLSYDGFCALYGFMSLIALIMLLFFFKEERMSTEQLR